MYCSVVRISIVLLLLSFEVYGVDDTVFHSWIGYRVPKYSLLAVGPYAGWGDIPDDVKDTLLGGYWRDCTHPLGSEEGLNFLLEQASERLKKAGKKAPEMVKDVTPTFNAYIKKNVLYAESWLKDAGSLKEVASNFLPGDEMAQATAEINMMTYYVHCYDHRSEKKDNMFMHKEMPTPDNRYGDDLLVEDPSEIINCLGVSGGWNFLYLFQEKYEFSFIDFVVALRGLGDLAVLPKNWNKKYSAHGGVYTGLFQLLIDHDFTHATNLERLLMIMENIDLHFIDRMNETIYAVLKRFWVEQGPRMLAGLFYVIHEKGEDLDDTRDHVVFEDMSALTKMQVILMAGAQRKVADVGMREVIRKIERQRYYPFFDYDEAIQEAAKDFVLTFMDYYRRFPMSESNELAEITMRGWFGEAYTQHVYADILPTIFAYINDKDAHVEPVHLMSSYRKQYLFSRRKTLFNCHYIGKQVAIVLPTKESVDGYSFLQRQQWVRVHRIHGRMEIPSYLQAIYVQRDLTTEALLNDMTKSVFDAIFGQGLHDRKLWCPKEARALWDEIADKKSQDMREVINDLTVEVLSLCLQKTQGDLEGLTDMMCQTYGQHKGCVCVMILYQEYIHAKHTKETVHKAIELFESKGWPKVEDIAKYEMGTGEILLEQLEKWQCLPKCVWSVCKVPLFERVVIVSKDQYPVEVLAYGVDGFESVYDQCVRIEKRIHNEASWDIDGVSILKERKRQAKEQVLGCWKQGGLFLLQGVDSFLRNVTLKRTKRLIFKQEGYFVFLLQRFVEDIEKAPATDSVIVDALTQYIDGLPFMQFCSGEKHMMYMFVLPRLGRVQK